MAGYSPTPPTGRGRSAEGSLANADDGGEGTGGFLSRWSRRKVQVRQGETPADPVVAPLPAVVMPAPALAPRVQAAVQSAPAPTASLALSPTPPPTPTPPPAPTLADVALLGRDSDYARFVAPGVDAPVRNAALKKLFTDPHFNLMDGLDTYIDDYGKPDPLPAGMLRQMAQSHALGLFDDEPLPDAPDGKHGAARSLDTDSDTSPDISTATAQAPRPDPTPALAHEPDRTPDEDADLRLQPHPAAGPAGPDPGAVPDAGRQH